MSSTIRDMAIDKQRCQRKKVEQSKIQKDPYIHFPAAFPESRNFS